MLHAPPGLALFVLSATIEEAPVAGHALPEREFLPQIPDFARCHEVRDLECRFLPSDIDSHVTRTAPDRRIQPDIWFGDFLAQAQARAPHSPNARHAVTRRTFMNHLPGTVPYTYHHRMHGWLPNHNCFRSGLAPTVRPRYYSPCSSHHDVWRERDGFCPCKSGVRFRHA